MICLLAAATSFEIAPLLERYRSDPDLFGKMELDIVITGIGLTASCYQLQRQVQLRRPDLIIQAGVAGCFDSSITLASVFAVKADSIADQGVLEASGWKSLFDMQLIKPNAFPYQKKWLMNPDTQLLRNTGLRRVRGISVNQISTSKKLIAAFREQFDATVESMEGAALHYVCLQEKIPFLQLRAVSNYVGQRDKKKWNMKESIFNLNNELIRVLKSL